MQNNLEKTWDAIKYFLAGQVLIVFLCLAYYGFQANARFYCICAILVLLNVVAFVLTPLSSNLHKVLISRVAGGALTGILLIVALSFLAGYRDQEMFDNDQKALAQHDAGSNGAQQAPTTDTK